MLSIAIIGAGPAGLTLARLLTSSSPSVTSQLSINIFERDTSRKSRFYQGGTLDLHPSTGLAALRKAGLFDEFEKHARYEGEELYICDSNATVYAHMQESRDPQGFESRPEIDRETLKDLLLDSVDEGMVHWGKKVVKVDSRRQDEGEAGTSKSQSWIQFDDGSSAGPYDLVIGADGAWSRVRNVLTDVKPHYSGICGFEGRLRSDFFADDGNDNKAETMQDWERISAMVGKGSNFSFSNGESVMSQRMGDGSVKVGFWQKREESWPDTVVADCNGDEEKIRRVVLDEYSEWDSRFKDFIRFCRDLKPWKLHELPLGHRWEHKPGFTLIGDSAHLMTPFAGEGVNAAMKDGLDLAEKIEAALSSSGAQETGGATGDAIDEVVRNFEQEMFKRMEGFMKLTMHNKVGMFGPDSPVEWLSSMIGVVAGELGYDVNKGALFYVPLTRTAKLYFRIVQKFGVLRKWLKGLC